MQPLGTVWTIVEGDHQEKTRRVLSETTAVMSLPVCHYMKSMFL